LIADIVAPLRDALVSGTLDAPKHLSLFAPTAATAYGLNGKAETRSELLRESSILPCLIYGAHFTKKAARGAQILDIGHRLSFHYWLVGLSYLYRPHRMVEKHSSYSRIDGIKTVVNVPGSASVRH
jgi:hypothetical protein